jgi:hypothetical protein
MLRRGLGGQPHAGADEQGAEPATDVSGRPSCRHLVTQELDAIDREYVSSVCVGRQHANVLFST